MTFGEVLRKIRKEEGKTLKEVGESTGILLSNIASVETNAKPASKPFVSAMIKEFSLYKHELAEAYLLEYIPKEVLANAKDNKNFILTRFGQLMIGLSDESRLELYKTILDQMAIEHLRNGTYEVAKDQIEETKKMLLEKENEKKQMEEAKKKVEEKVKVKKKIKKVKKNPKKE